MLQLGLGLGIGTGNGYFLAFFPPCLKVTNTFVLPSWPWLVRTPREDPRTPGNVPQYGSILCSMYMYMYICIYKHV